MTNSGMIQTPLNFKYYWNHFRDETLFYWLSFFSPLASPCNFHPNAKWTNETFPALHFFAFTDCPSMFHQYDGLIDMLVWDNKRLASVCTGENSKHAMGVAFPSWDHPRKVKVYVHVDIIWVNEVTLIASEMMTRRCHLYI